MKDTNLIAEIVGNLNELFFTRTNNFNFSPFELRYDGSCHIVKYMGLSIWDDDNEPRYFDEDKNEYEPLEDYIMKRALQVHGLCANLFAPPQACT